MANLSLIFEGNVIWELEYPNNVSILELEYTEVCIDDHAGNMIPIPSISKIEFEESKEDK